MIELHNIQVIRDRKTILGPLSLTLKQRDFLGVVGPNGAGKSTLLAVIAGITRPTRGQVIRPGDGKNTRNTVGLLFQQHDFHQDMPFTVQDVVYFGRIPRLGLLKRYTKADHRAVDKALSLLAVDHLRNRFYRDLSGGEKQKVQLARLLAQEARILLLDEPTTGLDLDWQDRLTGLIAELHGKTKTTVVMVTHHIEHLPAACRSVLLLREGKCLGQGAPDRIIHAGILSRLYGCSMHVVTHKGRFYAFSEGAR